MFILLDTSLFLAKLAFFSIEVIFCDIKLLNSAVVIYLSWLWSVILWSHFMIYDLINFCVIVSFLTKLLTLGILFLTALRAVLVAELAISGISFSIFFILALHTSFLKHQFLQHHLIYLNRLEQVIIYQHLIYLLYFSNSLN